MTVDARLGIAPDLDRLAGPSAAAWRPRSCHCCSPVPTAVLEERPSGWRYGMTEPMQPAADAVAES